MSNRLSGESSPYLLQHAENPVDWYPWGPEALQRAKEEDLPIFLSIGYSACHWCHVMEHESFEDPRIAGLLNESFVCIKVDREERPDLDQIYMNAVQIITGRGGWPMSVFLTPDLQPFYGGTYWPPTARQGMPGFDQVVSAVADAWNNRREQALESAAELTERLQAVDQLPPSASSLAPDLLTAALRKLERVFDSQHGGFGDSPKFPHSMDLQLLLRIHHRFGDESSRAMACQTLDKMAQGGIRDHLGGGFARYSTDRRWLVPHFEKMLYDNALLLSAYATGASLTGDAELAEVARRIVTYLTTELMTEQGVFIAATDADSEGVEGRYFVWDDAEFRQVVGDVGADPATFAEWFGVRAEGNWEGTNVLHTPFPLDDFVAANGLDRATFVNELEQVRTALLERRALRVPPGADDKILTDWNAMAIRALVMAARALDEPAWLAFATQAANALHDLVDHDGVVQHSWCRGVAGVDGFLDDYANLALADLEVFAATGEARWFERAVRLAGHVDDQFSDPAVGDWFQTASGAQPLVIRPKSTWDNATPSGSSVMVEVCLILADLTGDHHWRQRADRAIAAWQAQAQAAPTGFGWLLRQIEGLAAPRRQVAIVGEHGDQRRLLERVAVEHRTPGTTIVISDDAHGDHVPLLAHRRSIQGRPAAYVCRDLVCDAPVTDPGALEALLKG